MFHGEENSGNPGLVDEAKNRIARRFICAVSMIWYHSQELAETGADRDLSGASKKF
jgi:hypothetical protein